MSEVARRSAAELAALLPYPDRKAHKYSRGALLVVGGSAPYPGAAILAAKAAQRCGAGYVRLAMPHEAATVARNHVLSIPVSACSSKGGAFDAAAVDEVRAAGEKCAAFVVGPGMGTCPAAAEFLERLLAETDKPLVLDADALNIIAARGHRAARAAAGRVLVLTPHEGEAARLLGHPVKDRVACARELAQRYNATVALKGPGTLACDGQRVFIDDTGGPELACAGSGDVLAGMVGAFLTQRLQPLDCVSLAVYLHGSAGAAAAASMSSLAVTPEDVIDFIGSAVVELGLCA